MNKLEKSDGIISLKSISVRLMGIGMIRPGRSFGILNKQLRSEFRQT